MDSDPTVSPILPTQNLCFMIDCQELVISVSPHIFINAKKVTHSRFCTLEAQLWIKFWCLRKDMSVEEGMVAEIQKFHSPGTNII